VVIFQWVELLRERLSDHHATLRCASGSNNPTVSSATFADAPALNDTSVADGDWPCSSSAEAEEVHDGPTVYAMLLQIDHMNDRKGSVSRHHCSRRTEAQPLVSSVFCMYVVLHAAMQPPHEAQLWHEVAHGPICCGVAGTARRSLH
jgi:hypothetical protein